MASSSISSPIFLGLTLIDASNNAIPPPETIPSLIAAFVAHIASSTLSDFSFNSTSELAPTFTIATLADNLDSLLSNLITSPGALASLIWFLTSCIRLLTSSVSLSTCSIVS